MNTRSGKPSRSIAELADALRDTYSDGAPTEAAVREQGFRFYRDHWVDRWPASIALPPALAQDGTNYVDRDSLLRSAATVTDEQSAIDFYVRVCSWGAGTSAQRVARCVRPLHQAGAAESLLATHAVVRSGDAVDTYAALSRGGQHRIKHLGPAFFTKWLYFSAYDDWSSGGPAPLILDARVATALGWWSYGWSATDYSVYLHRAEELRQQWCPARGAHVVEFALFTLGGKEQRE